MEFTKLPAGFEEIAACAENLVRHYGDTFVRVDLYSNEKRITLGEFSATPHAGRCYPFADRMLGAMWARMLNKG